MTAHSAYRKYLRHKLCGWTCHVEMSVWHTRFNYDDVCPRCGAEMPYDDIGMPDTWEVITARRVLVRDGFMRHHYELRQPNPALCAVQKEATNE